MKPTPPRWIFGVVLVLALSIGAVPAAADPPPQDPCEGEYVNGWCVLGTPPYTVFEDPPHPQIPQSGDTGTDGEQSPANAVYAGCVERSASLGSYTVVQKSCLELRPATIGQESRQKTRFTFWYDGPAGRVAAYGNVRWDVKWNSEPGSPNVSSPLYRRVYKWVDNTRLYSSYTANRPDAIGAHTTVGYSLWGCGQVIGGVYFYGRTQNHFVRMPQGSLYGPFSQRTNGYVNSCAN